MHTVHQRSWLNTSWKMLLLLFAYSLLLALGLMAAAVIGSINA
jgi:hypothetical protein